MATPDVPARWAEMGANAALAGRYSPARGLKIPYSPAQIESDVSHALAAVLADLRRRVEALDAERIEGMVAAKSAGMDMLWTTLSGMRSGYSDMLHLLDTGGSDE